MIEYGKRSFNFHYFAFYRKEDGEIIILDYDIQSCLDGSRKFCIKPSEYLHQLFYKESIKRINKSNANINTYDQPNSLIYGSQFLYQL